MTPGEPPARPSPSPLPESVRVELAEGREARRLVGELSARVEQIEQARIRDREDLDLARAGWTDPEALDLLRYQHGRLPEQDRPALAEWARGLTPETAPPHLRVYLPGAAVPQAAPAATTTASATTMPTQRPAAPQPAPGTSPTQAPPTGGDVAADLRTATAQLQGLRPGQPGYDEARARVLDLSRRLRDQTYRR